MSSIKDTKKHIKMVQMFMMQCIMELCKKSVEHDASKLKDPEKKYFDEYTPLLKELTYGSDEYFKALDGLKPALDHHYKNNSHHPEAHPEGINNMTLMDITEMFCDWFAASKRHNDGDIYKSIKFNKDRFGISDQLCQVFENTVKFLEKVNE